MARLARVVIPGVRRSASCDADYLAYRAPMREWRAKRDVHPRKPGPKKKAKG